MTQYVLFSAQAMLFGPMASSRTHYKGPEVCTQRSQELVTRRLSPCLSSLTVSLKPSIRPWPPTHGRDVRLSWLRGCSLCREKLPLPSEELFKLKLKNRAWALSLLVGPGKKVQLGLCEPPSMASLLQIFLAGCCCPRPSPGRRPLSLRKLLTLLTMSN